MARLLRLFHPHFNMHRVTCTEITASHSAL